MNGAELVNILQKQLSLDTDTALAAALGLTQGRISQIRSSKKLSAKQVAKFFDKAIVHKVGDEFVHAVEPLVEFFEIKRTETSQNVKWNPFDVKKDPHLREKLDDAKGVYAFYNSEGEIIYLGKTKGKSLFNEMKNAFNRDFPSYQILTVKHPWKKFKEFENGSRQIKKGNAHLHETARYFSCYKVSEELISPLEALLIRMMPNNLINVKIEKLKNKKIG